MALSKTSMISRLKPTVSVDIAREADNGLIVPCVKEPDGLITPCVKEAAGVRIELAVGGGLIVPCIKEPERIAIGRVPMKGLSFRASRRRTASSPPASRTPAASASSARWTTAFSFPA